MITTPTTFVIGAGASKDYGLPTSAELRAKAHSLKPSDTAYKLIYQAQLCTPEQLNTALDDLRNQGTSSIDEFLFARQDDLLTMEVGRALIALLLGSRFSVVRSIDALRGSPQDWLGYIIDKMQSGAPNCKAFVEGNTQVRFVTFNFDSIIEDRFEKAIRNLYRPSEAHLQEAVNVIHGQIIHVHGKLTPPPLDEFACSYGWLDWLRSATSEIRVVMDDIDPDILADAQNAVKRSEVLCFLGFAYARDNLEKLDLPKARDHGIGGKPVVRHIFGTAFGMRPGETAPVKNMLLAVLGGEKEHCIDFLRNHHIFRG
ncbi:MAG: hypothetical protein F4X39_00180 [Acidobacteriia bacterium]|nr:hypothetical protein [Terriglobia bacterium]